MLRPFKTYIVSVGKPAIFVPVVCQEEELGAFNRGETVKMDWERQKAIDKAKAEAWFNEGSLICTKTAVGPVGRIGLLHLAVNSCKEFEIHK